MENPNPPKGKNSPSKSQSSTPAASNTPSSAKGQPKPAPAAKGPAGPVAPVGPMPPLFRGTDWFTFAITTLLVFLGYLYTLAPDLTLEDSGELATGSFYAGVPHPPGYPVWTIYSWFFTLLPISNIAYRVGLSSAVAGAIACGMLGMMVSRGSSMIIEGIADLKNLERKWENVICMVSGFVAALLFGFNGFMWSQATIVEVYTLSVLSMNGVLLCLFRWVYAPHQKRYLYLAFFLFGICFNNHQSLLVISLGMEVLVLIVLPRLGRELFFWNSALYLTGLILRKFGFLSVLTDNDPLFIIYNLIGILSALVWGWQAMKTKVTGQEIACYGSMMGALLCVALIAGSTTPQVTFFEGKTFLFVLLNLACLGLLGSFVWLAIQTRKLRSEWAASLISGGAWMFGAAFYLFMPLASMSNPPLNWGYPRTVTGFFHAFMRGQYERIHPTTEAGRFLGQVWGYIEGLNEEFNLVYVLIALIPFLYFRRMQLRERAWTIGLSAIWFTLSIFLLVLLNPSSDRQTRDLVKVFFTASHVMVAMGIGYGLTLLAATLNLHYEKHRKWVLIGAWVATGLAACKVIGTFTKIQETLVSHSGFLGPMFDMFVPSFSASPTVHVTVFFGLTLAVVATLLVQTSRTRIPLALLLAAVAAMPMHAVLSHWEDNEQRGHLFGYWFGHDMFTPPFTGPDGKLTYDSKLREQMSKDPAKARLIYPEMDQDTVLFGGTDPGRFNPTYMIYCESFIPPSKKPHDPGFDRRDVYLITQNALADGTYLSYIRAHYNRSTQPDPYFFSELVRGDKERGLNYTTNLLARAMLPFDRYFTKLGDDIEKRRRVGESYFKEGDFIGLKDFAARLKPGPQQTPLSKYLFENLAPATQTALAGGGDDAALRRALAKDLNAILDRELEPDAAKRKTLYEAERFKGIELTARTQRFLRQIQEIRGGDPKVYARNIHTPVRLARQLLEEAYPKELARSIGGVYPDLEIHTPSNDDSQKCFQDYLGDAQKRLEHDKKFPNEPKQVKAGEDVRYEGGRVQVSGQVAVMAINALLTKVIFDANPDHEFYVEESFPLDWMYPHLTPYGIIMKINRQPLPELGDDIVTKDHEFWSKFSDRLIGDWIKYETPLSEICDFADKVYYRRDYRGFKGDPKFIRDNDAQKAFSKLRSSISGVYSWRIGTAKSVPEQQRMLKEAEFAFKQAYAFCPYSPEAVFRYVNLLIGMQRTDDAMLLATTSRRLDPNNGQMENLVNELDRIKRSQAQQAQLQLAAQAPRIEAAIAQLEQQLRLSPTSAAIVLDLMTNHMQLQRPERALQVLEAFAAQPNLDAAGLAFAASAYGQFQNYPKMEAVLARAATLTPEEPEAWYNLATARVHPTVNKPKQALESLKQALHLSKQRLAKIPTASNLWLTAGADPRFEALRSSPEFKQILAAESPMPTAEAPAPKP